jgi:hypothetical protein
MVITWYKDQEKISTIMIHLRRREKSVETLPNFIKRKHPIKGEKKKQTPQGPKSMQAKTTQKRPSHGSKRTTK